MRIKFASITFIIGSFLLLFPLFASAHPGAVDAQGGHYDRSTGSYHFHHGYPAHQHVDGTCPYDFDNKTGANSGGSSSGSGERSVPRPTENWTEPTTGMETTRPLSLDTPYVHPAPEYPGLIRDLPAWLQYSLPAVVLVFVLAALIRSIVRSRSADQ